jgi:NADH-quinone oxidoreductase subunit M
MFILIGNFGSRQRKIHASFQFFLFTNVGSFLMLVAILLIFLHEGSTDFQTLYFGNFSYELQLFLWICFFFSLAVKVPLFPVHIWLPEAHVEAPTIGSVILAGVLLKMGTYGMLRFVAPLFSFGNFYFNPLVFILSFMSIYYISIVTFCQIDLKKLIAYSSVAHMGYVTLGLFTYNFIGLQGSIFLMLSHGIVSSLLFFLIGIIYDRYKTRLVFFYKSIYSYMPLFTLFLFFATLANVGFPGTIGFIGEFLLMFSFLSISKIAFFFSSLGFLISITYSFWLYNRISFLLPFHVFVFSDLSKREFYLCFPFIFMIFYFGLFPSFILNFLEPNSLFVLIFNPFLIFFN